MITSPTMKLELVFLFVGAVLLIDKCSANGQTKTVASETKSLEQSLKKELLDVINYSYFETLKSSAQTPSQEQEKEPEPDDYAPQQPSKNPKWVRLRKTRQHHHHPSTSSRTPSAEDSSYDEDSSHDENSNEEMDDEDPLPAGRSLSDKTKGSKTKKPSKAKGKKITGFKSSKKRKQTTTTTTSTTENPDLWFNPNMRQFLTEPPPHPPNATCSMITWESNWEDQIPIRPCHYTTHDHPRQQVRPKLGDNPNPIYAAHDKKMFHHMAVFNIKHDLDFQEAGDPCSVEIHREFMFSANESGSNAPAPVDIEMLSFNRVWYKRLCSFFSFLECVPANETRRAVLQKITSSKAEGAEDDDNDDTRLNYTDSGLDTKGLLRLKIGGRGPGKARHKSGPGGGRLDPRSMKGMAAMQTEEGLELDGICVCSAHDPKYPDRVRTNYGMDFVEDEARPRWCVAAPGNLCGRVFFKKNLWPGQIFWQFSDHISCPRRYKGEEYECVRWQEDPQMSIDTDRTDFPDVITSTCEKKIVAPEVTKARMKQKEKDKKKKTKRSDASIYRANFNIMLLILVLIVGYPNSAVE